MELAEQRLRTGFALDRRYAFTMGLPQKDKESALVALAQILADHGVPYAVMGGIAVQIHTEEPRTTLDIDIAVRSRSDVPEEALREAGFQFDGRFPFSDNWRAPGPGLPRKQKTPIQFSADSLTSMAVDHAAMMSFGEISMPIVTAEDLVRLKLAAAQEPRRRPSKRISDYGDIIRLVEEHPEIRKAISDFDEQLAKIKALLP